MTDVFVLFAFSDYCIPVIHNHRVVGWFKKSQLQGRDQGTTQFCSIYQMYYSCKILASYSIWKWVFNDPKFCPLETQFKFIEQAHCSTESLVVSSSGWLAITMWWNLFCDRRLCCDMTSLVPQTFPFLHASSSKVSGEKSCMRIFRVWIWRWAANISRNQTSSSREMWLVVRDRLEMITKNWLNWLFF